MRNDIETHPDYSKALLAVGFYDCIRSIFGPKGAFLIVFFLWLLKLSIVPGLIVWIVLSNNKWTEERLNAQVQGIHQTQEGMEGEMLKQSILSAKEELKEFNLHKNDPLVSWRKNGVLYQYQFPFTVKETKIKEEKPNPGPVSRPSSTPLHQSSLKISSLNAR